MYGCFMKSSHPNRSGLLRIGLVCLFTMSQRSAIEHDNRGNRLSIRSGSPASEGGRKALLRNIVYVYA